MDRGFLLVWEEFLSSFWEGHQRAEASVAWVPLYVRTTRALFLHRSRPRTEIYLYLYKYENMN